MPLMKLICALFILISVSNGLKYNIQPKTPKSLIPSWTKWVKMISLPFLFSAEVAFAVSGGGKDFAAKDLRDQIFDGQVLTGKDFTQCDGSGASFKNSKLQGTRFYKAKLSRADFTGADLSTASLEDTSLNNAIFENAVLQGAYFSSSITEAKSIEGADFTDALMPDLTSSVLCKRLDIGKANPTTGVTTAESLLCE